MPGESAFKKFITVILNKLFKINDTPRKIALGVGLGVFSGLMPGTGPAAAVFLAFLFRANRGAALLGSLLTNTWLSLVTFLLAIKAGSFVLGLHWQDVNRKMQGLFHDFGWAKFFKLSFLDVLLPVITGYMIIGLFLAAASYLLTLAIIRKYSSRLFPGNKH